MVVLVQMPFAAVERPSIGLGLLSATLTAAEIPNRVVYPNFQFAERIGLPRYRLIEMTRNDDLLGEWIFAPAAFRDQTPSGETLLDSVDLTAAVPRLGSREELLETFTEMRSQATRWVDEVAQELLSHNPRVIGASSMFQQHCASLAVLRRVKELAPEVVTMMGGANCDGVMGSATFAAFPWLDYVVCGEADDIIVKVVSKALGRGADLLPADVLSRQHQSAPGERSLIRDLDSLPTPDFTSYFNTLGASRLSPMVNPGLLIETSRGCWWGEKNHCTFCGLNASGMAFRAKSAARILEELDELSEAFQLTRFELTDNILAMQRFRDLLPQLAGQPYTMFAEVKANLRRDHMQALAAAGVLWIQPGLESMDDRVLQLMNKGTTTAINLQLLKWAREFGIFVSWNFLTGFPGEEDAWYEELAAWLPSVFHLQPPQGVFRARFDRYSPYQTAPDRYGLKVVPHPAYRSVYPVSEEVLKDLAYFHLEEGKEWGPALWDANKMGPGHAATQQAAQRWWPAFYGRLPVILSMNDDGETLRILDTRPGAQARRVQLTGSRRALYLFCDSARSAKSCAKEAGLSAEEATAQLEELCASKLMLHLADGRFLALAVAGEMPSLLKIREFPGGACQGPAAIS